MYFFNSEVTLYSHVTPDSVSGFGKAPALTGPLFRVPQGLAPDCLHQNPENFVCHRRLEPAHTLDPEAPPLGPGVCDMLPSKILEPPQSEDNPFPGHLIKWRGVDRPHGLFLYVMMVAVVTGVTAVIFVMGVLFPTWKD